MATTSFQIYKGLPFSRLIRLKDGRDTWGTIGSCEIRCQVRVRSDPLSQLIVNMHDFMSKAYGTGLNTNDIEISWDMTGADTAGIDYAGRAWYDLIVSDTGTSDVRAIMLLSGEMSFSSPVTRPAGVA